MISVDGVSVHFGNFVLLDDISLLVSPRDRIGLTGKNGAGKTTLLKILSGLHKPTGGTVTFPSAISVGYLPQQMEFSDHTSVLNEAKKAFSHLTDLAATIDSVATEIANRTDYESESYLKACDRLAELQDRHRIMGGENIEAETELALIGLGFSRYDFNRPTNQLSGGWRMRVELAKILLRKPSLLLLDEPTNHLDIESIEWLESYLKSYPGEVVLVSHDRAFLDNITTRTIEISLGKIYDYRVPYTHYLQLRKERREQQMAAYRNQQKMIGDTEQFIERFRYKNTKAVQVQSRIKQLDRLERIEVDEEDTSHIKIRFAPAPRAGTIVIEAESLSKSYGDKNVLNNIDLIIERGEKIALVGKNGEGKTTLSKIIMDEVDYSGTLKKGHNLRIGYFAQNQDELLDENLTVFQTIDNIATGDIRSRIRDILGAFLFSGEDIDKKVKVLSGGERSRLALIKLLLEPYNLLLLDEPTNHLDLRSKDILKQALQKYDGTLIVVSHDRDFLDGLVSKLYEFRNKKVKEHLGSVYDFLRKKRLESLSQLERQHSSKQTGEEQEPSENKQNWLERKETEKKIRKLGNQASAIEKEIEKLESEKAGMEKRMSNPDSDPESTTEQFYRQYESLKKKLEEKLYEWEIVRDEAEKLKSQA